MAATRVRGRLLLAFAYILVTVIVALEVPLAINLQRRTISEAEADLVNVAQATASRAEESLVAQDADQLSQIIERQREREPDLKLAIVDADGTLVAVSGGTDLLGRPYDTAAHPEIETALNGRPAVRQGPDPTWSDQEVMSVAVPVLRGRETIGAVQVAVGLDEVSREARRAIIGLIGIGLLGLAAGLLIAFVLAGSFSRPLRRVAAAAARLGRGDLSARAGEVRGAREIEEVGHAFDDMAARLEATVRAQREFTANASHQLRTPLTGLKLRLESAQAEAADEHAREQLRAAEREVDRLADIIERLLILARRIEDARPAETVDLASAAERAAHRLEAKAIRAGATLSVHADDATASAEPSEVDQILDNLVDNAISYAAGPIAIQTGRVDGRTFVAVEDRGPGIPEDEVDRVTERFYRGRGAPPGGSGLGLAIVRELAERSGGTLTIAPTLEGGTRVEVRLPVSEQPGGITRPAGQSA